VYPDIHFEVIGENSVTVIDGSTIQSSNVAELEPNELLAIVGVSVHILPYGYGYDLRIKEVVKLER
jgi:cyanophycinase